MSDRTHIEWTDASWNPLRARVPRSMAQPLPGVTASPGWACVRVSAGCTHCYAATINHRLGTGLDYTVPAMSQVETYLDEAVLAKPLSWRKPRRIFVCSMTDLFGEWVTDEQIDQVFEVMLASPRHIFQVLTKREHRMRSYLNDPRTSDRIDGEHMEFDPRAWPLPNVWLGTSVEDQAAADKRIPELLACPAAVRFLSVERLLGPVSLLSYLCDGECYDDCDEHLSPANGWVIVGGESGPGARPCDVAWVRSLVSQCRAAGVACFVKQLGAKPYSHDLVPELARPLVGESGENWTYKLENRKGGDMAEWPADLRVREFPEVRA